MLREALKKIRDARVSLLLAATAVTALGGGEAPQESQGALEDTQKVQTAVGAKTTAQEARLGLHDAAERLHRLASES